MDVDRLEGNIKSTFKSISRRSTKHPSCRRKKINTAWRGNRRTKKSVIRGKPTKNNIVKKKSDHHFKCNVCEKRFRYRYLVRKHVKSVHPLHTIDTYAMMCKRKIPKLYLRTIKYKTLPVILESYDYFTRNKNYHKNHASSKEKPYCFCPLCNEIILPKNLTSHVLEHCVLKPCTCLMCSKKFSSKKLLKRHIKDHLNKLDIHDVYKCDRCCTYASSLRKHIKGKQAFFLHRTCMKQQRYSNMWNRRRVKLNRNLNLNCHELILCNICGICDRYMKHYQNHMYLRYEYSYCLLCSAKFKNRSLVPKHIRSAHEIDLRAYESRIRLGI